MLNFFRRTIQARPRPFLKLQKFLEIEEEWPTFKAYLRPHKLKLLALLTLAAYPLYKPYFKYLYTSFNIQLQDELQLDRPGPQAFESFVKQRVENVLRDPDVKTEGALFLKDVVQKDVILEAIVSILVQGLRHEKFLDETKALIKNLTYTALNDEELVELTVGLVTRLLRDYEVRNEGLELTKWLTHQRETKDEFIDMWRAVYKDPKFQSASREVCAYAVYEILKQKETVEKLKLFSFYLLENDSDLSGKKDSKGLVDLLMDKVSKGYKVENKESELKKVLTDDGNEDIFASIEKRKQSAQADEKEKKKFPFF